MEGFRNIVIFYCPDEVVFDDMIIQAISFGYDYGKFANIVPTVVSKDI